MMMRKPARGAAVFGATTALVVGMSMGTAFAATKTFTVKPGGTVTAKSGKTVLTDTASSQSLACSSSKATATLKSGSHLAGKGIGKITKVIFSSCTGPLSLTFTVKTSASKTKPWHLNAVSYNKKTGVTKGTITGITATLSGPSCTASVAGASATSPGKVKATYSNKTHKLTILAAGGNLHVYNVNGCASLINSGDPTTFKGVYKMNKAEKITSP